MEQHNQGGGPRLYHKKSRTGCNRCRQRRVKCDEKKPTCGGCARHSVPCAYIKTSISPNPAPQRNLGTPLPSEEIDPVNIYFNIDVVTAETSSFSAEFEKTSEDIPESKARRKLELRLLQNFIENTSQTFSSCNTAQVRLAWANDVPKLALEHDNLLYGIFSISASHLLKSNPDDSELIMARQAYEGLSLSNQRKAVASLSPQNANSVCIASSLILIDAFESLQRRSLTPYLPPVEWLRIARGGASMYSMALHTINDLETSSIRTFATAEPVLSNLEALFADSNRESLQDLLSHGIPGEKWDGVTQATYEKALSYIGGIQIEIDRGEHPLATLRRMMAFPILVPKEFVEFVDQKRPRALVVLAHFFALAANMNHIWWIGNTVKKEIEGIRRVLPKEWQVMVHAPLLAAGLASK